MQETSQDFEIQNQDTAVEIKAPTSVAGGVEVEDLRGVSADGVKNGGAKKNYGPPDMGHQPAMYGLRNEPSRLVQQQQR
jgi:hypothetical protein